MVGPRGSCLSPAGHLQCCRWTSPQPTAWVINPRDKSKGVTRVDLGDAAVLEEAIMSFLEELVTKRGLQIRIEFEEESPTTTPATDRLRELLWNLGGFF